MKRYISLKEQLLIDIDQLELEEGFFDFDSKKFKKLMFSLAKKYNAFYDMIKIIDNNRDGKVQVKILYPTNQVGYLTIAFSDNEEETCHIESNKDNDGYVPLRVGKDYKTKDVYECLKICCNFCYNKIFKNSKNDLDAVNYNKFRWV